MKLAKILFVILVSGYSYDAIADNNVWNQKANFGGTARHRCTAFAIGNKGYIGLGHINAVTNILYSDFWEYDPSTNAWTQKADFGGGLRYHSVGFTIGNKAYVGTGRNQFGSYTDDLWEFDPIANDWIQKASIPGAERRGAISFVINNIGYVGTGEVTGAGFSNEFYSYDPLSDSWQQIATFPGAQRTSSVAFSIGDKGYMGTGGMGVGMVDFWEYDPTFDLWTQKANVGTTPRQEAVGFSINGKGYIGTGDDFDSGNNFADMWEYDPNLNSWTQTEDFGGIARRYLVAFVIGSKVYAGTGTNGTNFRDFWEFDKLLSVDEESNGLNVSLYPNPVSDKLIIEIKNEQLTNVFFQIYDVNGQIVFSDQIVNSKTIFERNNLSPGTYFYTIVSAQDVIQTGQLIFD